MNGLLNQGNRIVDEPNQNGKERRNMSGTNVRNESAGRSRFINRRRWPRLVAALTGVMLVVMQAAPILAASSGMSRSSMNDLSYRLGKEETGYGLGGVQFAPASSSMLAMPPMAAGIGASASAGGLDSASRTTILNDALDRLQNSQQANDQIDVDEQDEADRQGQPDVDEPAEDAIDDRTSDVASEQTQDTDSSLAQSGTALVVSDDFLSRSNSALWQGEWGNSQAFVSEEDGGWFIMLIEPGIIFPLIATGDLTIQDGAIMTAAGFYGSGYGEVGLFGRSTMSYDTYYYCGADVFGGAGCYLYEGGQWYDLMYLAPGEVTRYEVDTLLLEIDGGTLTFIVNDTVVGSINNAGMAGGSWGLATLCYEGQCAGAFDYVDVYDFNTSAPSDTGLTTVFATDFVNEPAGAWFTGQGEWGFADLIEGRYLVSMAPGWYFPNTIAGAEHLSDGLITMDAAFEGQGAIGLVARYSANADGYGDFYVCWLTNAGTAGCNVVVNGSWYEIEAASTAQVAVEDVNRLAMGVHGKQVIFVVNGQLVVDVLDETLPSGGMGFYHEAFADSNEHFISYIDAVKIEVVADAPASSGFQTLLASDMSGNDLGLYVDQGEWGATGFVEGWYATQMAPGWWFPNTIAGSDFGDNSVLTAVMAYDGDGAIGLVARAQDGNAGMSYYVCWVNSHSYAGCSVVVNDEWYSLGVTEQPIAINEVNTFNLGTFGSEITFAINGEIAIQVFDDTLTSGEWGFYTEAFGDGAGFVSYVDSVMLEAYVGS